MGNIYILVGAGYGDEGKGLMTDYICNKIKTGINIRHSSGPQAGHTVHTKNEKRHVFGHIGSGSFVGMPTYLSSFFVANPLLYNKEYNELKALNVIPNVYLDNNCMVTTPYDMIINQISEIVRGEKRHGSCGVGFNETITRNLEDEAFAFKSKDLMDERLIREKLKMIKDCYLPKRLRALNIDMIPERYNDILNSEQIIEKYIADINFMLEHLTMTNLNNFHSDQLCFEGAQGLLLDQEHPNFPHVTRSNTGIKNAIKIIKELGRERDEIEIIYITRAYMTRHGRGPFPTEVSTKPYPKIEDLTNIPNPYQETLRFGLMDLDSLADSIKKDLGDQISGLNCKVKLAVTCLDQLDGEIDYFYNGIETKSSINIFLQRIFEITNIKSGYASYGPTRDTVNEIEYH